MIYFLYIFTGGYNNVVDRIGRKIQYINDDSNIRDLKVRGGYYFNDIIYLM
jgi:hypothetical protein